MCAVRGTVLCVSKSILSSGPREIVPPHEFFSSVLVCLCVFFDYRYDDRILQLQYNHVYVYYSCNTMMCMYTTAVVAL